MALETISLSVVLIQTFFWSLFTFSLFMAAHGTETDIYCLRSIEESLEDPNSYLSSSWDFANNTEGFIRRFTGVACWHTDENRVLNLKLSNMGLKGPISAWHSELLVIDSSGPLIEPVLPLASFASSAAAVIVAFMYYCVPWAQLKKMKKNRNQNKSKKKEKEHKESNQMSKLLPQKILQKGVEIAEVDLSTLRMDFMDLCSATNHFNVNSAIGVGMSGIMYKANLQNGWSLAVKRLYNSEFFQRQFNLEMSILIRPHRNIVPLLGFCVEKEERILVYRFMPNGKLSDWLGEAVGLEWPVRARIVLGLARSLSWLHHSLHFAHLSVSSECILLDQNFEPKLSNFGHAKFINQNTNDEGSNYEKGFIKKDVYDFGIVLFELITGDIFNQKSDFFNNSESTFATHSINLLYNPAALSDTIDRCLIGKGFEGEIFGLLTVACDCVQNLPEKRPTMLEIYKRMSNMWERHGQSEDSEMPKKSSIASVGTSGDEIVEFE